MPYPTKNPEGISIYLQFKIHFNFICICNFFLHILKFAKLFFITNKCKCDFFRSITCSHFLYVYSLIMILIKIRLSVSKFYSSISCRKWLRYMQAHLYNKIRPKNRSFYLDFVIYVTHGLFHENLGLNARAHV